MARNITIALACGLVAACGAPLTGDYSGTLTTQFTCPGEAPYSELGTITMSVVETSDGAALDTARCGKLRGSVEGSTLRLEEHTCPPTTTNGVTTTITFTNKSTVTVTDDTLNVNLHARLRVNSTDCTMLQTGSLARDMN